MIGGQKREGGGGGGTLTKVIVAQVHVLYTGTLHKQL